MKKHTFLILISVCLLLQVCAFYGMEYTGLFEKTLYESSSQNKKNHLNITRYEEDYYVSLSKGDKTILHEKLPDFQHMGNDDIQWVTNDFVILTYQNDENEYSIHYYDVESSNVEVGIKELSKALHEQELQQQKQKIKNLHKEENIKTETGISLQKNDTLAVTYDYGKHWKDTHIPLEYMTFANSTQLRLSDESYYLSKDFSYIYYCTNKGWLIYAYSYDAGTTWNHIDTHVEAINTLWFQGGIYKDQPYFIIADKTYGANDCLDFYDSTDSGTTFVKHHISFDKDMNYLSDVSYVHETIFVTMFQDSTLYVTRDMGEHFDEVKIGDDPIQSLQAPYEKDNSLQLIAHTQDEDVIYISKDNGYSWIKK